MDIYSIGLKVDSRQVKTAQKDLNRFGQTAKTTEATTAKLGRTLAKLGGAVGGLAILRQSITTMMDFNKAISGVQAVTGAAGAELEAMEAKARRLGATTQFSATQAANAFEFLGMAGFSASESIESIGSVLDLAAASGMDLARSADIASNVLSGFQLEAEEAGRMADVLAKGASSANTNVEQLGNAMQFVAPVAATLGISVEESTAAIGALSNAGIQGQKAGTGLRRVLIQLIKPTDQAAQALSKYGLSLSDVDPSVRNFTDILETLRDRNISAADSAVIFGAEGVSAYQALAGQISGIRQLNDELENSYGAALEMASQRTDNLAGDLLDLKSAFSELQIALLGDEVDSALRSATQAATALTRVLGENADAIKAVAQVGATLVAMRLAGWAYGAVGGLAGLQAAAKGAATGLTTAAGAARALRGALAFLGGPAGLLVGVGSLALSFASSADEASGSTTNWADEVERLRGNMEALERQRIEQKLFEAEEEAAEVSRLNEALAEAQRLYSIRPTEGRKERVDLVRDERDEAQSAAEAAVQYRLRLEELNNQQTENTESTENQTKATEDQAKSFEELRASVDPAFAAALDYRDTIHELKDALEDGNITNQQYVDLVDKAAQSMFDFGEESEDAAEKATDAADEIQKEFDRVADSIEADFSDAFFNIFDEGLDAFDDLADGILDIFRRTLADMAAAAIRQQIVIPITQQIVGGAAGALGIPTGGVGGLPTGVPGVGNLAMQGLGSVGNFAISPGAASGGLGIGNIAGTIGRSILGPGAGIGASFATSSLGASLGLSAAAGGPAAASAAGAAGLTPVAGTGSALTGAGSAIAGAAGIALPLIGLALMGGLFSDGPTTTRNRSYFAGGDKLSFTNAVYPGDVMEKEDADKITNELNRELARYAESLDEAVQKSFGEKLSSLISEDRVRSERYDSFVDQYFGEEGEGLQAAINRLLGGIFENLGESIPGSVGIAIQKIDQESENFNQQLITVTDVFANSTGRVTEELNKFVNNTDTSGQQFVQSLQYYNAALQQLQKRDELDLIEQISGAGTSAENIQQYVEVANAVDNYTFSIKSQAEQARITRDRLVEFSEEMGLSEEKFLTNQIALENYLESLDLTTESGREAAFSALQLKDSIALVQDTADQASQSEADLAAARQRNLDQRAEEIAAEQKRVAEARASLESQLLESFGRSAALVRQQLAGMTAENAALQIALNLRENIANAEQQVASAEQDLAGIYREQASEASNLADEWKNLTGTLRDAADELFGFGAPQPGASQASFRKTLQRALGGDRDAFDALPQLASDLSEAERSQAGTLAEARRANAKIAVDIDRAADRAEQQYMTQLSEKQIAERQLEKLTEQELTLDQAKAAVSKAEQTLKAAQDASTQAVNQIGELLPDSIVNGLLEPLSPLEQIDASTKSMVSLLSNLEAGGTVGGSTAGTTGGGSIGGGISDADYYYTTGQGSATYHTPGGGSHTVQGSDALSVLKDTYGNYPEFADGGIASGPTSGYQATLHGTEAIIPLNGQRIPLEVNNQEMIQELRDLRSEVSQLRTEQGQSQYQIARNTKRTRETLEQFDIEGLPPERSAT